MNSGTNNISNLLESSKKSLFLLTLSLAILSSVYLLFSERKYRTFMVIVAETNGFSSSESLVSSALTSSFGGLGSAVGIDGLSGSEETHFQKVLYLMNSIDVSKRLINENPEIIKDLFPAKEFDVTKKTFKDDNVIKSTLKYFLGMNYLNNSPEFIVSDKIKKILNINKDKETDFTVLSIDHKDPEMAKALLENIYLISEEIVKNDNRDSSLKKIDYFEKSLADGNLSVINANAFTKMANIEYQKFALSSSGAPFASQIIQSTTISPKPVSPNSIAVIFVSLIIWLICSVMILSFNYKESV